MQSWIPYVQLLIELVGWGCVKIMNCVPFCGTSIDTAPCQSLVSKIVDLLSLPFVAVSYNFKKDSKSFFTNIITC